HARAPAPPPTGAARTAGAAGGIGAALLGAGGERERRGQRGDGRQSKGTVHGHPERGRGHGAAAGRSGMARPCARASPAAARYSSWVARASLLRAVASASCASLTSSWVESPRAKRSVARRKASSAS